MEQCIANVKNGIQFTLVLGHSCSGLDEFRSLLFETVPETTSLASAFDEQETATLLHDLHPPNDIEPGAESSPSRVVLIDFTQRCGRISAAQAQLRSRFVPTKLFGGCRVVCVANTDLMRLEDFISFCSTWDDMIKIHSAAMDFQRLSLCHLDQFVKVDWNPTHEGFLQSLRPQAVQEIMPGRTCRPPAGSALQLFPRAAAAVQRTMSVTAGLISSVGQCSHVVRYDPLTTFIDDTSMRGSNSRVKCVETTVLTWSGHPQQCLGNIRILRQLLATCGGYYTAFPLHSSTYEVAYCIRIFFKDNHIALEYDRILTSAECTGWTVHRDVAADTLRERVPQTLHSVRLARGMRVISTLFGLGTVINFDQSVIPFGLCSNRSQWPNVRFDADGAVRTIFPLPFHERSDFSGFVEDGTRLPLAPCYGITPNGLVTLDAKHMPVPLLTAQRPSSRREATRAIPFMLPQVPPAFAAWENFVDQPQRMRFLIKNCRRNILFTSAVPFQVIRARLSSLDNILIKFLQQ